MKFANVLRGTEAEKPVVVPGYDTDGKDFVVLMRPLTGTQLIQANEGALTVSRERGVENPKIGDTIFDLALMAHILFIGCVDPDSDPKSRTPSFESPVEILDGLHPEEIVYLHTHHDLWQNECSPTKRTISDSNLLETLREVAGSTGELNFMRMSANTQVSFAIITARTLLPLLEAKSLPGTSSANTLPSNESSKS